MDLNQTFRQAESAFSSGQPEQARGLLLRLLPHVGENSTVLHLLALVERQAGRVEAALASFGRAIAVAPRDPQLLSNYANLLGLVGRLDEALAHYDAALALSPGVPGLRLNRALLLQRADRHEDALAELDALAAGGGEEPKLRSARAISLHKLGRLDEAAADFDAALAADPGRSVALSGRARVALERGEPNASVYYDKAMQVAEGSRDLLLGLAEALVAEGDPRGLSILSEEVKRHPDWCAGLEILARMRAEAGEDDFAGHYRAAVEARPLDAELRQSYCHTLALAGRHGEALELVRSAPLEVRNDRRSQLSEAFLLEAVGNRVAALRLLEQIETEDCVDPSLALARGRIALANGNPELAANVLERVVTMYPDNIEGWAYLDVSWRLLGDDRHLWLSRQDGLIAQRSLDLNRDFLSTLKTSLQRLHRTRSHPIGQSLRGGTQTRGRLFSRSEPEIKRLSHALDAAVRAHFEGMPAFDAQHPLLRHKSSQITIQGAWSVRLIDEGFHISHIHPQGILSSACHISLIDIVEGEGLLELGRPPAELGVELGPVATFRPVPGSVVLFPSYMFHGTTPFTKGERLTVAFDIIAQ